MRFGSIPIAEAEGAILAHRLVVADMRFKKGHRLGEGDVAALKTAGVETVIALAIDAGDEAEDAAAARLAGALAADNVTVGPAQTGRVNIHAAGNGVFRVERALVDAFNAVDPAITIACLNDRTQVRAGDMVATIKIIPLAVSGASLAEAAMVIATPGLMAVRSYEAHRVGLIATELPTLKTSVMDKTRDLLAARLEPSASAIVAERRVAHDATAVADAMKALAAESDMIVIFGASAVADPEDVIPAAIRLAGGTVEAVGMPVDPGNLLVLGRLDAMPVIGAPGCARSPKENGFDWVLARLLSGETVTRADIAKMGVGGLLSEIGTRPQPRNPVRASKGGLRVEGVLLAAGRASRMGADGAHKLLAEFEGIPLVRRSAGIARGSAMTGLTVVTGHRADEIEKALAGLDVVCVRNPDFASGMASSLATGIAALDPGADGALVLLADMPGITADHLDALIAAFRTAGGRAIVRAATGERRGNPVILPRATFDDIAALEGDVGARQIIETSDLPIIDVDIGPAAQVDVDTPEAVRAAGGVLRA